MKLPLPRGRLITLAIALFLLGCFLYLAHELLEITEGDTKILEVDSILLRAVATARLKTLNGLMTELTALGSALVLTILTTITVTVCLLKNSWRDALHFFLSATGAALLSSMMKSFFERARPEVIPRLVEVQGFAFPSGHSTASACIYLTLAIVAFRSFKLRWQRGTLFGFALGLIFAIGFSRVYLGVHYPSDVLAGICLGSSWALLVANAFAFRRGRRA